MPARAERHTPPQGPPLVGQVWADDVREAMKQAFPVRRVCVCHVCANNTGFDSIEGLVCTCRRARDGFVVVLGVK